MMSSCIRLTSLFAALARFVHPQTTSTEILGLVTDTSGAVAPGARVTITRLATGETRTALTDPSGEFSFPLIEIGEYTVRCEMQGFKTQTITGLRLEIQQKARVNFRLEVGERAEAVEVKASAVILKRNRGGSKGRYSFDQTHAGVFHFVYEIPFGKSLHGVAAGVLKGWQTNGILTLRSGFPFTITGGDLNTGGTPIRPDRIADGRLSADQRSRKRWFDPSAFRRVTCNIPGRPELCHYGSAGKAILDSPGLRNLDFSLFKNFVIRENFRLQFRSEFFNALNTPYFGQPNGVLSNHRFNYTGRTPRW
jgi:hypothetical protein